MSEIIKNRYDFVFIFDCKNGNPNGDPDSGNMPRIDPETGHGVVSDVCIKRKIRNYVDLVKAADIDDPDVEEGELGYKIYVQEGSILNKRNEKAYVHYGMKPASKLSNKKEDQLKLTKFMCDNFYDIRTFGAVMTTKVNCGQVRGPVQFCFGESVDPIVPLEMSITRMAATAEDETKENKTMGRKQYIPYGLYHIEGFVSAPLAEQTGFCEEDLRLLFEALMNMFEQDRSASRGLMTARKLVVFKHESRLGNAPAANLFKRVSFKKLVPAEQETRSYEDYEVSVNMEGVPEGVSVMVFDDPSSLDL